MHKERKLHTVSLMNEKRVIINSESNQHALEISYSEIVFLHLDVFNDTITYQNIFNPLDEFKVFSHH